MKAVWLETAGAPLEIREVPDPVVTPSGVVVRVLAVRVPSYTRRVFDGTLGYDLPTPLIPGPTCIGQVECRWRRCLRHCGRGRSPVQFFPLLRRPCPVARRNLNCLDRHRLREIALDAETLASWKLCRARSVSCAVSGGPPGRHAIGTYTASVSCIPSNRRWGAAAW